MKPTLQPSPPIFLRFAEPGDVDSLSALENLSFPSPWPTCHFLSELAQPHSFTLLACSEPPIAPGILGYIVFWLLVDELHILNLAVAPRCRRQGIGRTLILEAMRLARERQCLTAWLEVRPSNAAALALYTSLGFRTVWTRRKYYSDTGEDALILSFAL